MGKKLGIVLIVIAFLGVFMHSFSHALYMFQYAFMLLTHNLVMVLVVVAGIYLIVKYR